jgi:hypothetical protein
VTPDIEEACPSNGEQLDVVEASTTPSDPRFAAHSVVCTGVTLSSEESGSDGEVQSTPEGFVPKTPFLGMMFDSLEDALAHYNRYAKHAGFSVRIDLSRKLAKDGLKDKSVFVCNKSGKQVEPGDAPVIQRNRTITILTDCKAKLRVKCVGAKWCVTQFVEEHTHELVKKFALKKYLRSHKKYHQKSIGSLTCYMM